MSVTGSSSASVEPSSHAIAPNPSVRPSPARGFHRLIVSRIRPQTTDGVAVAFDVPDDLADTFRFRPGQYLTLRATIDGQDVRRSYSICSADDAGHLEVGIKRVEGGAFSSFAQNLRPGDTVEVMPPQGRFTVAIGGRHDYLLVAAGSGITPCLSIASSVLAGEPESTVTLVYGNRSAASVMFREEVDALKDRHTRRFRLFHVTSREAQDVAFLNGRIDGERIRALARRGLIEPAAFDAAYLCGPEAMIEDVSAALREFGMEEGAVRFELFTTAGSKPPPVRTAAVAEGATIDIVIDGSRRSVAIDGSQTVLAAAQAAGLDLPFSCAGGMCCTCRCRVVQGEAAMDVNYSLQDWEVEAGFTLACQARPKTDRLVVDFDAA